MRQSLFVLLLLITTLSNAQIQLSEQALIGDFYYDASLFIDGVNDLLPDEEYGSLSRSQLDSLTGRNRLAAQIAIGLLEEARFVFSGIIYGFNFTYVPSDQRRLVKEYFELKPRGLIAVGDPRLEIIDEGIKGDLFYVRIRYHLDERQMASFKKRSLATMTKSSAYGKGSLVSNFEGRKEAIENSAKEAIRAYARRHYRAKPRAIRGEIFIDRVKQITIESGAFRANGSFIFRIDEVDQHYLP